MTTNELYAAAEKGGITVERFSLPKSRSIAINENGGFVAIDQSVNSAEERVCLAHEMGHFETMSFYNMYSPLDVRGKHERRADRWAIEKLVPKNDYVAALKNGYTELHELAEYFGVTEEFMKKVAEFYSL